MDEPAGNSFICVLQYLLNMARKANHVRPQSYHLTLSSLDVNSSEDFHNFHRCHEHYGIFQKDEFEQIFKVPDIRLCPYCKIYFYVPKNGGPIKSIEGMDPELIIDLAISDSLLLMKSEQKNLNEKRSQKPFFYASM